MSDSSSSTTTSIDDIEDDEFDSDSDDDEPSTTLDAVNLSANITDEDFKSFFSVYGEVVSATVQRGSCNGQPQTGRVQFKRRADAEKAFISVDGEKKIDGRLVKLRFAAPPPPAKRQRGTSPKVNADRGREQMSPSSSSGSATPREKS
ncbi:hypothetical protein ACHQM5_028296 [Ranunculus cassubicifolius]